MRILRPIVAPSPALVAIRDPEFTSRGAIRPQVIGDDFVRHQAIFLQQFAHQFQRCGLIPLGLNQDIQNLSFAIHGAPEINHASIDLEIVLVQMPSCVGPWSTFARTGSDLQSKVVDPAAHGLIGQDDSAHSQQVFHVAKAEREPKI